MKKIFLSAAVQLLCCAIVLWVVWHHAHWSVAFLLTLMMLRLEAEDLAKELDKARNRVRWELYKAARDRQGS